MAAAAPAHWGPSFEQLRVASAMAILGQNERALFQFGPQSAEFKSKTKTRAIANRASNPDRPAPCSELDFHQFAGLQVDPSMELHARAA
jgi:hypothetical protein